VVAFDIVREEARIEAWLQRSAEIDELDWQHGQELREKAMRCLKRLDEESITLGQILQALFMASKLQRLATQKPTDRVQLTGVALDAAIEREIARLSQPSPAIASSELLKNSDTEA